MGLGSEGFKVGSWDRRKSKDSNKKSAKSENSGCWLKFKYIGGCMPLKARMDSGSSSGYTGEDEHSPSINFTSIAPPVFPIGLSSKNRKITTASSTSDINFTSIALPGVPVGSSSRNRKITTASSTSNITDDLKISSQLRRFSFHELKLVTRNFKPENLLGEGGFGCVFKGWISEKRNGHAKPGTGLAVAVKTLNHRGLQGHKEWLAEVNYLGALLHPNLVKLIGYCIEGDQRLLVYEFMARGSLENHLFRRSLPLSWAIRLKIVLGAARGLAFLHDEAKKPVIFRDFKSSNILLDAEYNAKLSDFGLAKDGPEGDRTHVSTRVMGTYGYAAPEYIMTGHLTSKSDVYSFGVVLLELLTGRKSMDKTRPHGQHNLVEWARPQMANRGMFYQLIDPRLEGHYSIKGAQKAVQLAASCLSRDPKARPRMSDVVQVLKALLNLQDMACSSSSFQTMEGSGSNHGGRCSQKTQYGSSSRGRTPTRSAPTDMQASPSRHNHLLRSPKPTVGLQASPSHHNHPLHSPKPNAGPQASPSRHNHPLHSPRYNVGPQASPSRHSHRLQSPKPYGGQH